MKFKRLINYDKGKYKILVPKTAESMFDLNF